MKPKYTTTELDMTVLPRQITQENDGWGMVCENHHGRAYWNELTGEFCWIPDTEKSKLSELTP